MDEESRAVAEIERRARTLDGSAATRDVSGVLHVMSAVETADSRLHVIRIGPHAPKSSTDFFVRNFRRAHADAIVTTADRHDCRDRALRARVEPRAPHELWNDRVQYRVLTAPESATEMQSRLGSRATVVGLPDLGAAILVRGLDLQNGGRSPMAHPSSPTSALSSIPIFLGPHVFSERGYFKHDSRGCDRRSRN
jgi:hypothetical protein